MFVYTILIHRNSMKTKTLDFKHFSFLKLLDIFKCNKSITYA